MFDHEKIINVFDLVGYLIERVAKVKPLYFYISDGYRGQSQFHMKSVEPSSSD